MRQDAVEGPRDALEVECLDQEHGVPKAADRHDGDALGIEVAATAARERL